MGTCDMRHSCPLSIPQNSVILPKWLQGKQKSDLRFAGRKRRQNLVNTQQSSIPSVLRIVCSCVFTSKFCPEPSTSNLLLPLLVIREHLSSLEAHIQVSEPVWREVAGLKKGEGLCEQNRGAEVMGDAVGTEV